MELSKYKPVAFTNKSWIVNNSVIIDPYMRQAQLLKHIFIKKHRKNHINSSSVPPVSINVQKIKETLSRHIADRIRLKHIKMHDSATNTGENSLEKIISVKQSAVLKPVCISLKKQSPPKLNRRYENSIAKIRDVLKFEKMPNKIYEDEKQKLRISLNRRLRGYRRNNTNKASKTIDNLLNTDASIIIRKIKAENPEELILPTLSSCLGSTLGKHCKHDSFEVENYGALKLPPMRGSQHRNKVNVKIQLTRDPEITPWDNDSIGSSSIVL